MTQSNLDLINNYKSIWVRYLAQPNIGIKLNPPQYYLAQDNSGKNYLILIYTDNYLRLMSADGLIYHCYLHTKPGLSNSGEILCLNEDLHLQLILPPDPLIGAIVEGL